MSADLSERNNGSQEGVLSVPLAPSLSLSHTKHHLCVGRTPWSPPGRLSSCLPSVALFPDFGPRTYMAPSLFFTVRRPG